VNLKRKSFRLSFLLIVLLITSGVGRAQEKESAPERDKNDKPNEEVERLKIKVAELETLLERQQQLLEQVLKRSEESDARPREAALKSAAATTATPGDATPTATRGEAAAGSAQTQRSDRPAPLVAGWDRDRAVLRSPDGAFEMRITGYGQLDFRGYQSGNAPPNTFLIRRARLSVEGKLQKYFDYRVEGDFADIAGTLLRDFYLRFHRIEEFQLSFGQFRVPISQEEIRSDAFQDFVERSLVNNLVPSRSPGVMASGVIDGGKFEYQVGMFNGKGLLANNNNDTPESAIRLRFNPWKSSNSFLAKGLIFGGAFTQGRSFNGLGVRGQTESRSMTFYDAERVNGKYIRANGEITWLLGPATIRAEYVQTNQRRENLGPVGTNLPGVIGKGLMAQATYLLTGENKPEAGAVSPKRSLFEEGGSGATGFGAWEIKFRYANLQISNATTKSNRAETFYFGPNWYLTRFVRYTLDFGIERFKDPARTPQPGDRNFFVVLSRIQVAF
jgi:phosphate-selective porin OprO/OprP